VPSPSVSVLIPTYDRAPQLAQAIASVRDQTMPDWELIVIDDGSRDETAGLLARLAAQEARLRVLRQAHAGPAAARNRGIEAARAPFTAFLDSDDLWEPGCLASQLACFQAHPATDLSLSDARYVGAWQQASETVFGRASWRPPTSLEAMFDFAFGLPSCMCVRTRVLRSLGFDGGLKDLEDTDFLFRFHIAGHTLRINPAVLTHYRRTEVPGTAPQIVNDEVGLLRAHLRILERQGAHAVDPRALRRRLARRWGLSYVREGDWLAARPHLLRWWCLKPLSLRAPRLYLRSLLAWRHPE